MASDPARWLQIKHFRLIHAIMEQGQLAIAAKQLSLTQPAASRMLAEIEKIVGAPVFERHPKGMMPTPLGAVLARRAGDLLFGHDETLREIESFKAGRTGSVRVGAVTGGAVAFVVPAIQSLKAEAFGADIHVDVAPSDALMQGLVAGDYDFVLSRIPPGFDVRQFDLYRGRVEEILFLVRARHPLANREQVALADLAGFNWVIQAAGTPLRQAVEEAFLARGLPIPAEIVNTTSLLVMIAYLASSDSISPIAREVAELLGAAPSGANIVRLRMRESIVIAPYHLVVRRNHSVSPVAQRLMDLVRTRLSDFNVTEQPPTLWPQR